MRKTILFFSLIIFLLTFSSCGSDDSGDEVLNETIVVNYPISGLLGLPITIEGQNFELNKVQVFFDLEPATVTYISTEKISVIVPRDIERYNPILKVIDLNTNTTILENVFLLKTPEITDYSNDEVTFDESFFISGNNFDILDSAVTVKVNDVEAEIINVSHNNIEIIIPNAIENSHLEIKISAQLQEVVSNLQLNLKAPQFDTSQIPQAYWSQGNFIITGSNFNPADQNYGANDQHGEVLVNGISCFFSANNTSLFIDLPPGPYSDFEITSIIYNTAGLSTSYNNTIDLLDRKIVVDYQDYAIQHTIFNHNGKAYGFKSNNTQSSEFGYEYSLIEFSETTEKWIELSNFNYIGYLEDAVYDGEDTVYLYKREFDTTQFTMTKLNMNTFIEENLMFPFGNDVFVPTLFCHEQNFYFVGGLTDYATSLPTVVTDKYKYSKITNTWVLLPDSSFGNLPLVEPIGGFGKARYIYYNGETYIDYGNNGTTFRINSEGDAINYPHELYFEFQNVVFGGNYSYNDLIYDITTLNSYIDLGYDFLGNQFFVANNNIYFHQVSSNPYYTNMNLTYKLKNGILNELL